tara:strand:- start:14348 stop:14746 length:399 start_codon:yes stop_codon:yes gene_type:complete
MKTNTDGLTVGKRIKKLRLEAGLTQEQLASHFLSSDGQSTLIVKTISLWESDVNRINIENLVILCNVLDTTPNYVLGFPEKEVSAENAGLSKDEKYINSAYNIADKDGKRFLVSAATQLWKYANPNRVADDS